MTDRDIYNMMLHGAPILETNYLSKFIICRRHKKKRINKKLTKKYGVKKIEVFSDVIFADGNIYCSPKTAKVIRKMMREMYLQAERDILKQIRGGLV